MIDALGEWMSQPAYFSRYGQESSRRTAARHPSIAPYGPYRTGSGVVFLGVQNDREWDMLCRAVLRRPGLIDDQRFRTNADRVANHAQLTSIIEKAFTDLRAEQAIDLLEQAGIANARPRTADEFIRHPQLQARQRFRRVDTPDGPMDALLPLVEVAGYEPPMGPVPPLGQHNDTIRAEFS